MKYTSSSFAGTIIAVIPVVGIILDVLIMKVQVSKKQIFCALASVAGVALTTLGAEDMKSSFLGLLLLLIAVVTGSLFYVFSKKAGIWFNALERTYVMFGIGSATYLLAAVFQCGHDMGGTIGAAVTNPTLWICMLYLSGASSVGAFLLLNYGSSYVTVSEASLCANFSTVISIVAGIVVLRETFSLPQMLGAATLLISVYLANIGEKESIHSKK